MSVCRLSVHADQNGRPVTVDMALPSGTPVGALLPTIVALAEQNLDESPQRWRLDRLSGVSLDESITLADNGVHDGELLLLAASDAPSLGVVRWGRFRTAAEACSPKDESPVVPGIACVWAAVVAALALFGSVSEHSSIRLIVAAIGACIAAAMAVTGRSAAAAGAAVSLAAATGFLAVPSGPAPANGFLAAAAAASMSLVLLRCTDELSSTLVATACFSTLAAVAVIVAVVAVVPVETVGAILSVVAVGVQALSGRISILLSGLTMPVEIDERAIRGHATLTGLVGGCSAAAALGTVLVAVGCHRYGGPSLPSTGFAAVIGVVLLLRMRTHVDAVRRRALEVAGLASVSASFAIFVTAHPAQVGWASAALIAAGLGATRPPRLNAVAVRAVEIAEYAALVAVIPLACWVGGLYAMVRGASLP